MRIKQTFIAFAYWCYNFSSSFLSLFFLFGSLSLFISLIFRCLSPCLFISLIAFFFGEMYNEQRGKQKFKQQKCGNNIFSIAIDAIKTTMEVVSISDVNIDFN